MLKKVGEELGGKCTEPEMELEGQVRMRERSSRQIVFTASSPHAETRAASL